MTAGGSAAEKAASARRSADQKLRAAERAARVADAWAAGEAGERRVADILAALEPAGFVHLADRSVPASTANIDHVVVGPPAVFVIDAKAWSGSLTVDRNVLRQDHHARRRELEAARATALLLAEALDGLLEDRVDVRPALCFVGDGTLDGEYFIDRVKLINGDALAAWMTRFEAKLSAADIIRVHQHLANAFPAKVGEPASATYDEPPAELVVYLFPWKKSGKNRLYVRSNEGLDVGYLDLVTGRVSSPSDAWEQILVQLLPHYVFGEGPTMSAGHEMSHEAQGALRRFIDKVLGRPSSPPERPIIACYRWRKHGKDRLYMNRLLPGGKKHDLGFFDLDTGFLKTNEPGATSVLGYCGQRFKQLELA